MMKKEKQKQIEQLIEQTFNNIEKLQDHQSPFGSSASSKPQNPVLPTFLESPPNPAHLDLTHGTAPQSAFHWF
jgi:hypothetical protein